MVLSWVISIGLLGCYSYTHLVIYIYLVPSLMNNNPFFWGFLFLSMASEQGFFWSSSTRQQWACARPCSCNRA